VAAVLTLMRGIILGSSSKSRQLILTELGLEFSTISANIDEKAIGNRSRGSSPTELVLQIARAKADHLIANNLISPEMRSSILLTADTVVVHKNQVIEKPTTASEYMENMKSYATAPCSLVSGVVATDLMNGKQLEVISPHFFLFTRGIRALIQQLSISLPFLTLRLLISWQKGKSSIVQVESWLKTH
jgi:predicted house-cleaning NTP pyrophosphatase (Maf/HAM1 superfamily)